MKRKNKKLFGFIGLGLVMAVTAIAYSLPAPGASAQDVNISVTVTAQPGSAQIISPEHGQVLTSRDAKVAVSYNLIRQLTTTVTCTNADKEEVYRHSETHSPLPEASGVVEDAFDLPEDADNLTCVASMVSVGQDNQTYDDSVSFSFRQMNIPNGGSEENPNKPSEDPNKPSEGFDENNNPEVEVDVSDDVIEVTVQVYDMDGNPVFVDADGKETPIVTTKDAFKDGKVTIKLPMSEYHAKPGKYVAYFIATNSEGKVVSVNEYWFEYWPVVETPGTGSIFKDMNLSKADYVWAGLVVFGTVAVFATYLVFRKSRR